MKLSDYLWFALFAGFGLWWLVFPRSVISFYTWFYRNRVKMPSTLSIRLMGVFWMLMVSAVMVLAFAFANR